MEVDLTRMCVLEVNQTKTVLEVMRAATIVQTVVVKLAMPIILPPIPNPGFDAVKMIFMN